MYVLVGHVSVIKWANIWNWAVFLKKLIYHLAKNSYLIRFVTLNKILNRNTMKEGIHPEYRDVVFQDTSSDFKFMTRSTMKSSETIQWTDGNTYPVIKVEVSSASHPFYTGKKLFVDAAGRVEKFNKKYKK